MSLLTEVKGWTPVIDALTKEHGLITSAVYGVVWRYCQMDDRVCKASLEVIGDRLNLNKTTVMRHIKTLCDYGYLEDLTPDRRNAPHVYKDTGKIRIVGTIEAVPVAQDTTKRKRKTVAQNNTSNEEPLETVAHNNSSIHEKNQTVAQSNATVAQSNATVVLSHLKKDTKRDSKKENTGRKKRAAPVAEKNTKPKAVERYREIARLYPDKATWPMIEQKVGNDEVNLTLWEDIIKNYIGCGWNKRNVVGMLDYYDRGEIPGADRRGNGHNKHNSKPLERTGATIAQEPVFDPYSGEICMS